jgi:nitroreductase
MEVIERIIDAGLKAPTNDHMRNWEFVIVNNRSNRAEIVKAIVELKHEAEVEAWLDSWGASDAVQRSMYIDAVPKQYQMLLNAGCLILPFFHQSGSLLHPETLSSLNGFASIWCCIENILIASAAEGLCGVTRIPMSNEVRHIKQIIKHPDDYAMPCYIALGYPAPDAAMNIQKSVSAKEKIHMDVW